MNVNFLPKFFYFLFFLLSPIAFASEQVPPTATNGFLKCPMGSLQDNFSQGGLLDFKNLNRVDISEVDKDKKPTSDQFGVWTVWPGFFSKLIPTQLFISKIKPEYKDSLQEIFSLVIHKSDEELKDKSSLFATKMAIQYYDNKLFNHFNLSDSEGKKQLNIFFVNQINNTYFLVSEGDVGIFTLVSQTARNNVFKNRTAVNIIYAFSGYGCLDKYLAINQAVFFKLPENLSTANTSNDQIYFAYLRTKYLLNP